MEKPRVFVSHISDEAALAEILKRHMLRDFLGLIDVFVSSDEISIEAGTNWLNAIEEALKTAKIELILCSAASVKRPWINFEAGAGWLRGLPILPICHTGLRPSELPMPLTVLQAIEVNDPAGLERLYRRIAKTIGSGIPATDFRSLLEEVTVFEQTYRTQIKPITEIEDRRTLNARTRIYKALRDPKYPNYRSLKRLAIMGGVTVSEAMDILQPDPNVTFDLRSDLGRIVRLSEDESIG